MQDELARKFFKDGRHFDLEGEWNCLIDDGKLYVKTEDVIFLFVGEALQKIPKYDNV